MRQQACLYLAAAWRMVRWLFRPVSWIVRGSVLVRPRWDPMLSPALMALCWLLGVYTVMALIFSGCQLPLEHPLGSSALAILSWRLFVLVLQRIYFPDWQERRESDEALDNAWKN